MSEESPKCFKVFQSVWCGVGFSSLKNIPGFQEAAHILLLNTTTCISIPITFIAKVNSAAAALQDLPLLVPTKHARTHTAKHFVFSLRPTN